jgi:hypothetical protein
MSAAGSTGVASTTEWIARIARRLGRDGASRTATTTPVTRRPE